ncbi:hypothetical protein RCL_jg22581.t1 [Rhizophagus clarus]|uniref:Uncharacterized protein n=1 Tax=Rhizophagus clarus TaxID=94130 RepID=A0A8H3R5G6_9GLOM|nr:hypothetical protein RCL_jg22581.t1 [Rhizophagus clarus]
MPDPNVSIWYSALIQEFVNYFFIFILTKPFIVRWIESENINYNALKLLIWKYDLLKVTDLEDLWKSVVEVVKYLRAHQYLFSF